MAALTYIRLLGAHSFVLSPNEIQDDFLSYTTVWPLWPLSRSGFEEVKTVYFIARTTTGQELLFVVIVILWWRYIFTNISTLYTSFLASTAQAMRANLLARATITLHLGFVFSRF